MSRPPKDFLSKLDRHDPHNILVQVAYEVEMAARADPKQYGAIARAIRKVALAHGRPDDWVAQARKRNPVATLMAMESFDASRTNAEIQSRLEGVPQHLLERLRGYGAAELLTFLRSAGVDKNAPAWLLEYLATLPERVTPRRQRQ